MSSYFIVFYMSLTFFGLSSLFNSKPKMAIFFVAVLLALFCGFRDISVGTDTRLYSIMYNDLSNTYESWTSFFSTISLFDEPGFQFIQFLSFKLGLSYSLFSFIISFLITFAYLNHIVKLGDYPTTTLFLYLMMGFYLFQFNGVRQAISMCFLFLGINYLLDKDKIRFLAIVFIGFLFHKSIICMLFLMLLPSRIFRIKELLILMVLSILLISFIDNIISFASTNIDARYAGFAEKSQTSGKTNTMFWFVITLFCFISLVVNKIDDKVFTLFLNLLILSSLFSFVSSFILQLSGSGIIRLAMYFNQFAIVALPIAIASYRKVETRNLIAIALLTLVNVYAYFLITKTSNLYPYGTLITI